MWIGVLIEILHAYKVDAWTILWLLMSTQVTFYLLYLAIKMVKRLSCSPKGESADEQQGN